MENQKVHAVTELIKEDAVKCEVCEANAVTKELTVDMCYPRYYTCGICGAEYILVNDRLVALKGEKVEA